MDVVRQAVRAAAGRRTYSTMYVPPAATSRIHKRQIPLKPAAESPNFYTGRAAFFDQVNALEYAIQGTRSALQKLQLLPLPRFALDSLPPLQHAWMSKDGLQDKLNTPLTMSRYRRLVGLLNQLGNFRRIADVAGCEGLAEQIQSVLDLFERENKEAFLARGKRNPVKFDEYGRTYTVGRRKESTARAWVIPVQGTTTVRTESYLSTTGMDSFPSGPAVDGLQASPTQSLELPLSTELPDLMPAPVKVTTTNILINNTPLSQYFVLSADRERVVRPFKIAGLVGAFNVFALVRGGGTTGQSGAISLAIAKALVAHVPDVELILRRAKLLRRDPRMVERKKTGLAKARKAYSWVKR
ncbi:hypothetical protein SCP_0307440 [Sparassis crispa]|uniref:37S ribosomal protein S9, mitochondrial n=1 Tax=Sparassis crispa TaxID=139825 RepID=A0A401GFW9_9APHY|nr:hypothetical protein SCP_0307440 [Sparassis crispa]GBE81021.1 hypothetical protein SCP_0307440 [Sparassis crispa]